MRYLITGATGFIGKRLLGMLRERGDEIYVLSRNPVRAGALPGVREAFGWPDHETPFPVAALHGVDAVINLAGEPVIGRFTEGHKKKVLESRVFGTRALVEAMAHVDPRPRVLVSSSAVGYYGDRGDETLTEASPSGQGFLAEVCRRWEDEARKAEPLGVRTAVIRTGIVLGRGGGMLKQILPPFRLGLGGPLGNGQFWMPWIHIDDLCRLYLHAATEGLAPAYNGSAPHPVTNLVFTKVLGHVVRRPTLFRVPRLAMRAALGEGAVDAALQSAKALPNAAEREGFRFLYPHLEAALQAEAR